MSNYSRHSRYSIRRIPRQKRVMPIYGERDDSGKYFRCWNCGFVCDVKRDRLTGNPSGNGTVTATSYTDNDDETKYYPTVVSGCPACGAQYK